ncbi:MAG TPA: sulfotransferase [Phototrophicaceae bacterium]|nr:sulfotransferase [Phototrophicaceae bacterium]
MTTIDQFQIAPLIRAANVLGSPFAHLPPFDLAPASLRAVAEHQTGLRDWGEPDFWPGFETLFNAINADHTQTLIGRMSFRTDGLNRLKNQLLLTQAIKDEPGIAKGEVKRPLIIVGFPRTGTTLLHHLLTQDPHVHVPLYWKLYTPLPLTVPDEEIERRKQQAESLMRLSEMVAPQWNTIHPTGAQEPEECIFLLTDNLGYAARANIPEYVEAYLKEDLIPVYRGYKRALQALQWGQPEQSWVLKSPLHLWALDALLTVLPDARIVMTHRDPKKAFASWCSLAAALGKMQRKQVNLQQIAREWLPLWKIGIERANSARDKFDPAKFFDVQYRELMADPLEMVRRIYNYFGGALTPDAEVAMSRWLADNAHGAHEGHRYSAAQYGLSDDQIEHEFADYTGRYQIPME